VENGVINYNSSHVGQKIAGLWLSCFNPPKVVFLDDHILALSGCCPIFTITRYRAYIAPTELPRLANAHSIGDSDPQHFFNNKNSKISQNSAYERQ